MKSLRVKIRGLRNRRQSFQKIRWKEHRLILEKAFNYYLELLEKNLRGEKINLTQKLVEFFGNFNNALGTNFRRDQAWGLRHKSGSPFVWYVEETTGQEFEPEEKHWRAKGLSDFLKWKSEFYKLKNNKTSKQVENEIKEFVEEEIAAEGKVDGPSKEEKVKIKKGLRHIFLRNISDDERKRRAEQLLEKYRRTAPKLLRLTKKQIKYFERGSIGRSVKILNNFLCQIPDCKFPTFKKRNGENYAEAHHLESLAFGGANEPKNIICLCANHHQMFHYGTVNSISCDGHTLVVELNGEEKVLTLQH